MGQDGAVVHIIGGGLAGCEAAWQLARRGVRAVIHEMKPHKRSEAHKGDGLAELVCSNSFRSDEITHAAGLLKHELRRLGSLIMEGARFARVPAGSALAMDRDRFSAYITQRVADEPLIEVVHEELTELPTEGLWIMATGPLTSAPLGQSLAALCGQEHLYFYDAIAPILDADSINREVCWAQSRYDKGDGDDYLNCPMDEAQYKGFVQALLGSPKVEMRDFEEARFFEGCLPIETMAERGEDVLRFGPMKPVGLVDPRDGRQPYAVVQLRYENVEGTAFNLVGFQSRMKWGAQEQVFRTIPGLEQATFLRFGSVHRNTFVCGPRVLDDKFRLKARPNVRLAGQVTGVEGYIESTAVGMLAAFGVVAELRGEGGYVRPPAETALGALTRHVCGELTDAKHYQPTNINWGLFPALQERKVPKHLKKDRISARGQAALEAWIASQPLVAENAQPVELGAAPQG